MRIVSATTNQVRFSPPFGMIKNMYHKRRGMSVFTDIKIFHNKQFRTLSWEVLSLFTCPQTVKFTYESHEEHFYFRIMRYYYSSLSTYLIYKERLLFETK